MKIGVIVPETGEAGYLGRLVKASKDEPRHGHAIGTLQVHASFNPLTSPCPALSAGTIGGSDIMKLKVS